MKGSVYETNRATVKPILIAGVEKRLMGLNVALSYPLFASTRLHMPASLIGVLFFIVMTFIFRIVSKHDPMLGALFKRSTLYSSKPYFPSKSHPLMTKVLKVKSVSRPW